MGLFVSNCHGCGNAIDWFLEAPSHTCQCGVFMTPEEVTKSWKDNYAKHLAKLDAHEREEEAIPK
jgi:hypothetical protein